MRKMSVKKMDEGSNKDYKYINVFGSKGVGKTRYVTQVAEYLR